MANDCLVTKLKGVVDNPDLGTMYEIRFFAVYSDNASIATNSFKIRCGKNAKLKAVGNVDCIQSIGSGVTELPTTGYVSEITLSAYTTYNVAIANMDCQFYLDDKTAVISIERYNNEGLRLNFGFKNLSQLDYASNLEQITLLGAQANGEISFKNNTKLVYANVGYSQVAFDIDSLKDVANAPFYYLMIRSTPSHGNAVNLYSRITRNINLCEFQGTKVEGDLGDLCDVLKERQVFAHSIGASSYMTARGSNTQSTVYRFSSSDDGLNYVVTYDSRGQTVTLGTYNTSTKTWSD